MGSTTKRCKIIGTEKYINSRTGEVEDFQVINIQDRDAHFQKLWIGHILQAVNEFGNRKMMVLMYLLNESKRMDNIIVKTAHEIAEEIGVSRKTVSVTISALEKHDIIRKIRPGVYMLNPSVIFKGTHGKRLNVLMRYEKVNSKQKDEIIKEIKENAA